MFERHASGLDDRRDLEDLGGRNVGLPGAACDDEGFEESGEHRLVGLDHEAAGCSVAADRAAACKDSTPAGRRCRRSVRRPVQPQALLGRFDPRAPWAEGGDGEVDEVHAVPREARVKRLRRQWPGRDDLVDAAFPGAAELWREAFRRSAEREASALLEPDRIIASASPSVRANRVST